VGSYQTTSYLFPHVNETNTAFYDFNYFESIDKGKKEDYLIVPNPIVFTPLIQCEPKDSFLGTDIYPRTLSSLSKTLLFSQRD
ncbi:hypothetical protein ACNQ05_25360, partial [Enterobacter cloacae complex sp.6701062]|uniref:hypothetical protein n=1 Tax=Enterobacter cloacae complex sp.6701062 TaxID=3397177 RepID=UPI003AAC5DD5